MRRSASMTGGLILALTGVTIVFWLLAVILGIMVMREEFDEVFDSALRETAERLLPLVVDDIGQRPAGGEAQRLARVAGSEMEEYLTYQVRDATGRVLMHSHEAPVEPFEAPLVAGFHETDTHRVFTVAAVSGTVYLQVADPLGHRLEAETESALALSVPLILLVPALVFVVWLLVRRSLAPVDLLSHAIGARDGGNLAPLPHDALPRELDVIAISVDRLLDRLRAALEAERVFAANSAHELRTPVAGALAQTQQLLSELPGGPHRARARQIEASLASLARLSDKLLQLSRAEAGIGLADRPSDLVPVIRMVVSDFTRHGADAPSVRLQVPEDARLMRAVDLDAFAIALRNLVENALTHGEPGRPVAVSLSPPDTLSVVNEGPLVPPDVLAGLAGRFRRGRTSAGGSGLGLAIADSLVRQMGGRLDLLSPAGGKNQGFEARIVLPDRQS